jgi:hypothetical protein
MGVVLRMRLHTARRKSMYNKPHRDSSILSIITFSTSFKLLQKQTLQLQHLANEFTSK